MNDTPPLHGGAQRALTLLRAELPNGALVGIAQADDDGQLALIDAGGHNAPDGLALGPVLSNGFAAWVDTRDRRLTTGWTLALGSRPAFVATTLVPGSHWVLVAALPAPAGDAVEVADTPSDDLLMLGRNLLAEAHRAGTGLARAESRQRARLDLLIRSLATPIVFLGFRDGEALFNPAAAKVLGLAPGNESIAALVAAIRRFAGDANLLSVMRTENGDPPAPMEIAREGEIWLLQGQRIDDAMMCGLLWQFTNITPLRRQERALIDGARAQTVARLAGTIAHEFNNLLTVVLGHAEAISDDASLDGTARRRMDDLVAAAERGAELVSQLMDYGPGRAGELRRLDLDAELHTLIPLLRQTLPPRIELDYAGTGQPVWLRCERGVLADTLMNLAINARDAMPRGGKLNITLTRIAEGQQVRLRVRDQGEGMSGEVLARAREPFFSTKGLANARGLGLAIADSYARRHGGALHIASTPGAGTVVDLLLPVEPSASS